MTLRAGLIIAVLNQTQRLSQTSVIARPQAVAISWNGALICIFHREIATGFALAMTM